MSKELLYQPLLLPAADYRQAVENKEAHSLIGPNNVILQVNYSCYLHCTMCDRHKWTTQGAPVEEAMTGPELAQLFSQAAALKTRKITLVGTEPVLRPDLPQILTDINEQGIKPEVYTAGIVLQDQVISSILQNSGDAAFSIDGFYPESHNGIRMPDKAFDAFSRTLSSISRLRSARDKSGLTADQSRITVNFTIQSGNLNDLLTAGPDEIEALGVDTLRLSVVHGQGPYVLDRTAIPVIAGFVKRLESAGQLRTEVSLSSGIIYLLAGKITPEDFDQNILIPSETLRGKTKTRCHIHEFSTMIDPEGNVRPCLYLYDDNGPYDTSNRDEFVMGNVKQNSMAEIWNGERYTAFRKAYEYPNLSPGSRCRTCEYNDHFEELDQITAGATTETVQIGW
jgi:radical SAM protein with 4Fe4S-binding SPASM domain